MMLAFIWIAFISSGMFIFLFSAIVSFASKLEIILRFLAKRSHDLVCEKSIEVTASLGSCLWMPRAAQTLAIAALIKYNRTIRKK